MELSKAKLNERFIQSSSSVDFYEKSLGMDNQEDMNEYLEDLLYREPIRQYLEEKGYELPKLLIESRFPPKKQESAK